MNWGMLPFHLQGEPTAFEVGDYIYVPGIRSALDGDLSHITGYVLKNGQAVELPLYCKDMTENERAIVKAGCLINFNRAGTVKLFGREGLRLLLPRAFFRGASIGARGAGRNRRGHGRGKP